MSKVRKDKKKFTGQVSLVRARKIFLALGFKTAGKWNETQLTKKIQNLPDFVEGTKLEDKMQKKINTICNALKKGTKVVVMDMSDEAADKEREVEVAEAKVREKQRRVEKKSKTVTKEKTEEKKAAKKEKEKTQTKKAVAAGKEKAGRDKFGQGMNTQGHKINACFLDTKKASTTMEEIVKKTGLPEARIRNHLSWLKRDGFIKAIEKGKFSLSNK